MGERTEADFLNWLGGSYFYVGYARYGQMPGGHGFVCATAYDQDEQLAAYVADLDGGDNEAIDAAERIRAREGIWWANDRDPSKAMHKLVGQLRQYYFGDLNKQSVPSGHRQSDTTERIALLRYTAAWLREEVGNGSDEALAGNAAEAENINWAAGKLEQDDVAVVEALRDLVEQAESCDGTSQLDLTRARAALPMENRL